MVELKYGWVNDFVKAWSSAWNAQDTNKILEFYDDEVVVSSPAIRERLKNVSSAVLYDKKDLVKFCELIFEEIPQFRIEVLAVAIGIKDFTIHYRGLNEFLYADRIEIKENNMKISRSTVYY